MAGELRGTRPATRSRREQRRALGLWIWSILLIVDAVLLTRRFAGQLTLPVPDSLALLSTVLIAATSWLAWILQSQPRRYSADQTARGILSLGITSAVPIGW